MKFNCHNCKNENTEACDECSANSDECCSCHVNPPCSYCVNSLYEER